jgi:hypothetical protein
MSREKSRLEEAIEDLGEYRDCGLDVSTYLDEVARNHRISPEALRAEAEKLWNSPLEQDKIRNADYFLKLEIKERHQEYLESISQNAFKKCLEVWADNPPNFAIDWQQEAKKFLQGHINLTADERAKVFRIFRDANGEHSKCKAIYKAFGQRR